MISVMLAAALAPAVILVIYIYIKDKYKREPLSQILKGILYGVLSAFIAIAFATLFQLVGLAPAEMATTRDAFMNAFFGAAIPEESAKLLMLWLLVRRNPYFDEYVDGIVYAVALGMGFAGFENILYVFQSGLCSWVNVAWTRAILSVPGHYMFAVIMGYYYSYCHFHLGRNVFRMAMVLVAPVILHGLFDAFLMETGVVQSDVIAGLLVILFLALFVFGQRRARKAITRQLARDSYNNESSIIW